jgi:hypothetical protein
MPDRKLSDAVLAAAQAAYDGPGYEGENWGERQGLHDAIVAALSAIRAEELQTPRDYSNIAWPWDGDECWDQPREGATSDAADDDNWAMTCRECRLHFPMDINVGTIGKHWVELHHPEQAEEPKPELMLTWIGLGTPPQPRERK